MSSDAIEIRVCKTKPDFALAEQLTRDYVSRLDMDFFPEYIDKWMDPRDRIYYWQGCDSLPAGKSTDIDGSALCEDFISITPIKCDQTDYQVIENLKEWKLVTRVRNEKRSQK